MASVVPCLALAPFSGKYGGLAGGFQIAENNLSRTAGQLPKRVDTSGPFVLRRLVRRSVPGPLILELKKLSSSKGAKDQREKLATDAPTLLGAELLKDT